MAWQPAITLGRFTRGRNRKTCGTASTRVTTGSKTEGHTARRGLNISANPLLFPEEGDAAPRGPLATRLRPSALEDFLGQEAIVGPGTLLHSAIERDSPTSAIFWGPPGSGKTTLAGIVAARTGSHFETFSAVTSGVADVRRVITEARERLKRTSRRTILFVDEIHRFNKAQQDAFLPHVEDGTLILIGATTENPYFEVNAPLLSRARIFRFAALPDEAVRHLLDRGAGALAKETGHDLTLEAAAAEHLVSVSQGDARRALNALEIAWEMTAAAGETAIALSRAEQALQQRALAYDREGDQHYDVASAFIKSMKGSDPDATVYWMHRMLAAGEDPRFICRRMMVHAAEDVGLADPQALLIASAAAHALELVGLPEAQIPMTEAAIYIATAPKSNAVIQAISRAHRDLAERPHAAVPAHLRDAHYRGAARLGHGAGYLYPHSFPGNYVEQEYLPEGTTSTTYYEPSQNGAEVEIAARMNGLRAPKAGDDG